MSIISHSPSAKSLPCRESAVRKIKINTKKEGIETIEEDENKCPPFTIGETIVLKGAERGDGDDGH